MQRQNYAARFPGQGKRLAATALLLCGLIAFTSSNGQAYCACKLDSAPDVIQPCPCPMHALEVGRVETGDTELAMTGSNPRPPRLADASGISQPEGERRLMLFGGEGQDAYLGCLSCPVTDGDSIYNPRGDHGTPFGERSVYSRFGPFGSRFSSLSACNPNAERPPAVIDEAGKFYGFLTNNPSNQEAIRDKSVLHWLNERVCD